MTGRHAVIVGGGLAGLAAAAALRESGATVTLFEARPWLGGATHSFRRAGLTVDNGQHVFLKCCTAYRGFLERLGVAHRVRLQDRFDVTVLAPGRAPARLRRATLPSPLHFGAALAAYRMLTPRQRVRALRAARAVQRLTGPGLDDRDLGGFLDEYGQDEATRAALWDLFVVSGLNIATRDASLALAAMLLRTALLGGPDAADIGLPAAPLGELHGRAASGLLTRRGVEIHLKAKVTALELTAEGFDVVVGGTRRAADAVVVAVPHQAAADLVPPQAARTAAWSGLGASPIVNIHVVYEQPVTTLPFAAAVGSPVQWIFDRGEIGGIGPGRYLAVSVSAADRFIDAPTARLRETFLPELARLLPRARQVGVSDFFVTRERRATFRQAPGSGSRRPPAATALPGLYLAGSWTDTGWPDTMEGAVRSGLTAARLARRHLFRAGRTAAEEQAI